MKNRVAILHGVNFDVLDRRSSEHYGHLTYAQLETRIEQLAHEHGLEPVFFQTNHEGTYVEELHKANDTVHGLILNPGAWTHYSWAIRDALELTGLPAVEVHLSDLAKREEFRQVSVIADLCITTISGKGIDGYGEAFAKLRLHLMETDHQTAR